MSSIAFIKKFVFVVPMAICMLLYILLQENDATTKVVANIPSFSHDTTIVDLLEKNYDELIYTNEGGSSWYGKKFHNKKTASGEKYDMHALTAAHKSLPFGAIAVVENVENQSKTFVRINDRGPFHSKRIVDLSYASAKNLEIIDNAKVKIQSVAYNKLNLIPNFDYYIAHSLDKPFKCVPSYQVAIIDSTDDFELANELYNIKSENNANIYMMTKVNTESIKAKRIESEHYYIGVLKKNSFNSNGVLAQKR